MAGWVHVRQGVATTQTQRFPTWRRSRLGVEDADEDWGSCGAEDSGAGVGADGNQTLMCGRNVKVYDGQDSAAVEAFRK